MPGPYAEPRLGAVARGEFRQVFNIEPFECLLFRSVWRGTAADFQGDLGAGFAGDVRDEAQGAAAVLEDNAVVFRVAFIFAPFLGDVGPAGGLAKTGLWRGLGVARVEPIRGAEKEKAQNQQVADLSAHQYLLERF